MQISMEEIKACCNTRTFTRGKQLHEAQKVYGVRTEYETESDVCIRGSVEGSYGNSYHVSVSYDTINNEIFDYQCQCPAIEQYYGMCKHCVALTLQFVKEPEKDLKQFEWKRLQSGQGKTSYTDQRLSNLIYRYSMDHKTKYLQPELTGCVELLPKLHDSYKGWSIDFKIGAEHRYVLKDIPAFLEAVDKREKVVYGKKLGFIHEFSAFTKESQELIHFLKRALDSYKYYKMSPFSSQYLPAMRELYLDKELLTSFFELRMNRTISFEDGYSKDQLLHIKEGDPYLEVEIEKREQDSSFFLHFPGIDTFAGKERLFVRTGDEVYRCSEEFSKEMQGICELTKLEQPSTFTISENDMTSFCSTILPVLQKHTALTITEKVEEYIPQQAVIKIYLDYEAGVISCLLEADYGDKTYNLLKPIEVADAFRDTQKESAAVFVAGEYFGEENQKDRFLLNDHEEDSVYHLLTTGVEQLRQIGEVYISEAFKKLTILPPPKANVGVSLSGGLLDLTLEMDRLPLKELEGLLQNYQRRKKYYRLKSGEFISLEENSLSVLSELVDGLGLKQSEIKEGKVKVPKFRAMYVEQLLKSGEGIEVSRNHSFKSLVREMKSIEDSDFEVPESLKNILRHYQKTGYRWLRTLENVGFGGILADDMGLGKSLQVISFLLSKKLEKKEGECLTSLIVCPASLVYNWESEMEKFAPSLSKLIVAGNASQRKEDILKTEEYDVVITSYDLLKRDLELYQKKSFYAMIIDEAQNIKNHTTLAAKAVKEIVAQVRFALTGTPIENRLSELWSIFDFLMPGLLYSYQKFRNEFEVPIVQSSDEIAVARLQKMIKPFLLRRIKRDVLKEIPDKNEDVVYARLEGEQYRVYQAGVQRMLDSLNKKTDQDFQSDKLQILAEITKLRQICCAPSLVYANYKGEAAKLDTCMELLRNAMEGGHKILVFSQFTSIFDLLEKDLKKEKIGYYRLDGSTPKMKRASMVADFNKNEVPVFLISLKAGGTGLNLTSASIVIHFDPWWNVAAQNQATDRAHRIGQTKTVSVYKLIAKNTIEEKILHLQEAKKELSNQIISEGGFSVANLSKEDIKELLSWEE